MDIKSMAKSKRSHTKHNQPRKPIHQTLKPNSSNNANNPSSSNNKKTEKSKLVHQKPSIPNNWDRYDEEVDEDSGLLVPIGETGDFKVKKAVEGVKVKSKGADFGYLIEQAKEIYYNPPSFGDTLDDFYQGLAPMLDVKSEGIPLWDKDDDFLQENEARTSEEAPNFSLDLKALAEELAKAGLAKRLFIEADLLPSELRGQDANEVSNPTAEKLPKTFETFEELYSIYLADEKIAETEAANKDGTISLSEDASNSKSRNACQPTRMHEEDTNVQINDLGHNVTHVTDQASMPKFSDLVPPADDASKQDTPSRFVGDDSEVQLDMLLNSFSNSNLSNSQGTSTGKSVTHQLAQNNNSLDDELDDLLDTCQYKKNNLLVSVEVKASPKNDGATPGTPSQHFPDPSIPMIPVSSRSLDDELDNLFEETSKPVEVKANPLDSRPSSLHPGSNLEVLDDFDSWLDTL